MKEIQPILQLVFKAVALGMAVASVVLSIMGVTTAETNVMLLGIGLFALSLAALNRDDE